MKGIPKSKLKHGEYYFGYCRNARLAGWNGEIERFIHTKREFGVTSTESIQAKEDAKNNMDYFEAYERLSFDQLQPIPGHFSENIKITPVMSRADRKKYALEAEQNFWEYYKENSDWYQFTKAVSDVRQALLDVFVPLNVRMQSILSRISTRGKVK